MIHIYMHPRLIIFSFPSYILKFFLYFLNIQGVPRLRTLRTDVSCVSIFFPWYSLKTPFNCRDWQGIFVNKINIQIMFTHFTFSIHDDFILGTYHRYLYLIFQKIQKIVNWINKILIWKKCHYNPHYSSSYSCEIIN